jgi:hypothetical protein
VDDQQTELVGRNWLVSQLLRDGVEVARPERDRGVDLIAYLDRESDGARFVAYPIQMKAAARFNFGFARKYERFPNLLFAFVWDLEDPSRTSAACMTLSEVVEVCEQLGWTTTGSWLGTTASARRAGAGYSTRHRSVRLDALVGSYVVEPGGWLTKLRAVAAGRGYPAPWEAAPSAKGVAAEVSWNRSS